MRTGLFAADFEDACTDTFEFAADGGLAAEDAGVFAAADEVGFEAVGALGAVGATGTAAAAGFEGDCGAVAWAPN